MTPTQRQALIDMAAWVKAGLCPVVSLDMLINDIRRQNPELHHTKGAVSFDGGVPVDDESSLAERKFINQPMTIDCYASFVVAAPDRG